MPLIGVSGVSNHLYAVENLLALHPIASGGNVAFIVGTKVDISVFS
jgi:hypothetical protein